jgi:beta-galactosidase
MYPDHAQLTALSRSPYINRPIVMCEYMHAMGNSVGGLGEFWDTIRARSNLICGFIWDMVDQGLTKEGPDGKPFYANGGDFGDQPNDGNFCLNGVFASDRAPNPHAWECKYVFQPAAISWGDVGVRKIQIENRLSFTNLSENELRWSVLRNGKVIESGTLSELDVPALNERMITVPFTTTEFQPEAEYWLKVSLHEKTQRPWCAAGYEVATEQLVLREKTIPITASMASGRRPRIEIRPLGSGFLAETSLLRSPVRLAN